MQINLRILLLALPLLAAGCSDMPESDGKPRTVRVTVGSDPRIDLRMQAASRTSIGTDGETIRWNGNDTIALWAVNDADGTAAFEAHPFAMFHYNATYNSAKFTADIPPMEPGSYRYYAVLPRPAAVAGTLATFDIPAVQKFRTAELGGAYTALPYDVAVATPVAATELVEGDNSEGVNLAFHHKVHLLKVVVEGNELGEKVSEVVLTFPEPVAGRLTLDVADPDAAPVLTGGGNTLTLRFDNPVEPGTTVFASIAPADFTGRDITIVAYGETGESLVRTIVPRKEFAAGRTTPIRYTIPVMGRQFTRLTFAPAKDAQGNPANFLGEPVQKITLTAPAGATFDNGLAVRTFAPDAGGNYTLTFKPSWQDGLSEQTLTAQFESEHAIVTGPITLPAIRPYESTSAAYRVPYLFEENFDSVSQSGNSDDTAMLTDYNLPDWGASRYSVAPGRLSCSVWVASSTGSFGGWTNGRLDSPVLPLKNNAGSVTLNVSYRIGGTRVGGAAFLGVSYWVSVCQFGTETNSQTFPIPGTTALSNTIETFRPTVGGSMNDELPSPAKTHTVQNVAAGTRLSWRCHYERDKEMSTGSSPTLTRKTLSFYLDDIKVSIAQ